MLYCVFDDIERYTDRRVLFEQIKHMMAFIDQEASEKAEEIDAKVSCTIISF